jgi:hypothetical protein
MTDPQGKKKYPVLRIGNATIFVKRAIHFVAPKMSNSYVVAVLLNS